jgi:hypothetical protein
MADLVGNGKAGARVVEVGSGDNNGPAAGAAEEGALAADVGSGPALEAEAELADDRG